MEPKAIEILKEMLESRGIKKTEEETIAAALEDTKMYKYASILIIFSTKTRVGNSELTAFLKFAEENGYNAGIIIISQTPISESVEESLVKHITDKSNPLVQIFEIRKLQFNISKHRKVPHHKLLSDAQKAEITKLYEVDKMPKIMSQDEMAKFIGARPGDVVEVTGMCQASAENKRWRYCIPS
jgi:DNA-directed RNA polymerase subunit H